MLTVLIGRAGTGKTEHIMNEIKRKMAAGESGMLLIVPEQYSHDAEKQLCAVCGDSLSLHAETLSFTRLAGSVIAESGRGMFRNLDRTGQILAMHRALESVAPALKVFGIKKTRPELLKRLLDAVLEFKRLNIMPLMLKQAAQRAPQPLADKLFDLVLIYDAYEALLHIYGCDSAQRLTILADLIGGSSVGNAGHIFFDGFIDFTAQELGIIEELLKKGADMTICITCDLDDKGEIFEIPRKTVLQLRRIANDAGARYSQEAYPGNKECKENKENPKNELVFLEKHLFEDVPPRYSEKCKAIKIYCAPTRYVECEYAAYEVLKLVRSGYRWRDIGVMARDWDEYSSICENVFEKYGVPFFSSGKADILSKPPVALIDAALEIVTYGWEYKPVFRYLKSGLTDITTDQCALLENYVLVWKIRGSLWMRKWTMPPGGYGMENDDDAKTLELLNNLRLKIVTPLNKLREEICIQSGVEVKLKALYNFINEIKLQEHLINKSKVLASRGEMRLSDEYTQLWDIIIDVMEQMYAILGEESNSEAMSNGTESEEAKPAGLKHKKNHVEYTLTAVEFRKLFALALSQKEVGVIPIALDRTSLGGMAMSRRRDLKCLILLGASDDNIPALGNVGGALSDNERMQLRGLGTNIPAGLEIRMYREMSMLYSTLTLPSNTLIAIYNTNEGSRPSFVVKRLKMMFSIADEALDECEYMTAARTPYLELLQSRGLSDPRVKDAGYYDVQSALSVKLQDNLSEKEAQKLYGERFSLSATRVDTYYSCPYKHFLYNGLKLKPRVPAEFDAAAAGNFTHYVLDGVFKEVKNDKGFKDIKEEDYLALTGKYIKKFTDDVLLGFEGKNTRFEYLFMRYSDDVEHVVRDMVQELCKSDFEPLDLELDMSKLTDTERGFIDRVDGVDLGDRILLRVIDYKTRKKAYSFELTDVLSGRDMQMLIYLFALEKYGVHRYGKKILPVGVLYVPARDVTINASRNASDEEIKKQRISEMRRSGLVLRDVDVIEAMERGEVKEYLPVKTGKDGSYSGDSMISVQQLITLSNHTRKMMTGAKDKISSGDIECSPYYKSESDNACAYCKYHSVCGFDEKLGGKHRFVNKISSAEAWDILEGLN